MKNIMMIDGYKAAIAFDPEIDMFRGELIGLNGSADFYATDVAGLHHEGKISLQVFLDECRSRGIAPRKDFSGKFVLRVPPAVHEAATVAAAAHGESLNQWVAAVIKDAAAHA